MDLYVSLLSQAEHNQRLLLSPDYEMDKDVEHVLQTQRAEEEEQRRLESEAAEKEVALARKRELKEREELEAATRKGMLLPQLCATILTMSSSGTYSNQRSTSR